MGILDSIERTGNLTYSEQEVVQFILDNKDLLKDLTINELATATYTSNATIIRLCKKLGLSGYTEFRLALIKDIEKRRKETREIDMSYPFRRKESSEELLKIMLDLFVKNIK